MIGANPQPNREPKPRGHQSGFTLIELLVVMGILTGFLLMLVQLVDGGLRMFRDGETSQMLADRGSRTQRVITEELGQLRGSATGRDRQKVDDRLVVQLLPLGLPPVAKRGATRTQVLRAAVHLLPDRELRIVEAILVDEVVSEDPSLLPEQIAIEVQKRRVKQPLRGIGNLLMYATRQDGADDTLLELRAGWFLPGQTFEVAPNRRVDPFEVIVPGSEELPGLLVQAITEPIVEDLLHVEFSLWSQRTTSWGTEAGPLHELLVRAGTKDLTQPQGIWDSARGGWLIDEISGGAFGFDVGSVSEDDPNDDIHPHAIMVRCVVAQPKDATPEGLLAGFLGDEETGLTLYDGTSFPGGNDGGFIKIDGEWLRYGALDGDRLTGLRRGQRGTQAASHETGAQVHVGRTVEFVVPILHAKDDWNG